MNLFRIVGALTFPSVKLMVLKGQEVSKKHCWAAEVFAANESTSALGGGNRICMYLVEPDRKVG